MTHPIIEATAKAITDAQAYHSMRWDELLIAASDEKRHMHDQLQRLVAINRGNARYVVLAMLDAIREPSDAQIHAASTRPTPGGIGALYHDVWTAMIDALREEIDK